MIDRVSTVRLSCVGKAVGYRVALFDLALGDLGEPRVNFANLVRSCKLRSLHPHLAGLSCPREGKGGYRHELCVRPERELLGILGCRGGDQISWVNRLGTKGMDGNGGEYLDSEGGFECSLSKT